MILPSLQLQLKEHIRSLQPLSKQSRIHKASSSALPQTMELQALSNRHLPKCWIACSSVGVEVSVFASDIRAFDNAQATGKGFPSENAERRFLMLSLDYTQSEFTAGFDQDTGVSQSTTVESQNSVFRKNCASGPERMRTQLLLLPVVPGHCWLP